MRVIYESLPPITTIARKKTRNRFLQDRYTRVAMIFLCILPIWGQKAIWVWGPNKKAANPVLCYLQLLLQAFRENIALMELTWGLVDALILVVGRVLAWKAESTVKSPSSDCGAMQFCQLVDSPFQDDLYVDLANDDIWEQMHQYYKREVNFASHDDNALKGAQCFQRECAGQFSGPLKWSLHTSIWFCTWLSQSLQLAV